MKRPILSETLRQKPILSGCIMLVAASSLILTMPASRAADIVKADNATNLNLTGSWSGGLVPTFLDVALWNSTVTSANTVLLGANLTWGGIRIANPAGAVTISAGNTLTLGANGIDMSAATQNLTIGAGVTTAANTVQTWNVSAGRTLSVSGTLTRTAGTTLFFSTNSGGVINLGAGTASALLNQATTGAPYSVVNTGTVYDFAALDASKNVVAGASVLAYVVPTGSGNITMAAANATPVDVVNGTGVRLGNSTAVTGGLRFNTPTAINVDTAATNRLLTTGGLLITPNVGSNNVSIGGAGAGMRPGGSVTGGEFIIHQYNPSGALILNAGGAIINNNSSSNLTIDGPGKTIINNNTMGVTGVWRLLQGTLQFGNNSALGNFSGSSLINNGNVTFARTDASTFTGVISGTGAVTQAGAGSVSLTGTNTYTGPTNFNGGLVGFASLSNLGAGTTLNFDGGGLQWNASTTDISTRTVAILTNGGTLNTNGNNVTLASSIGAAGTGSLTKTGAGTLTLSAGTSYTGNTIVTTGSVVANGSMAGGASVGNGTTLGGAATYGGTITVNSGGIIAPGNSVGTITTNALNLAAGSILNFEFNTSPANDYVNVTGTNGLTLNGGGFNLYVEGGVLPFSTVGTYNLLGYSGTIGGTGTGALSVLNPQPGKTYLFGSTLSNVTLDIGSAGFLSNWNVNSGGSWGTAGNWSAGVPDAVGATANMNFSLGAPGTVTLDAARTIGAISFDSAQGYTIAEGTGGTLTFDNGASQANIIGTTGSHTISAPVTLNSTTVAAIAGGSTVTISGAVGGAVSLTKSGNGVLDLTNVSNGLSGSVTVAGGTLGFAALGSLGSGSLTLDGGALRYDTGNTDDISTKTVTLAIGGGTINTNGNDVTLANAIGNAGAGGLTKSGAGTLTLGGTNTQIGATTISGGTLSISSNGNLGDVATGAGITLLGGTLKTTATFGLDNAGANFRSITLGAGGGTISTDAATTLTVGGTVVGSTALTKTGAGTLTMTANNAATFSGVINANEGTIQPGGTQANGQQALGTGGVAFAGGTLRLNGAGAVDSGTTYGNLVNAINVPVTQTGTLVLPKRVTISSVLTGAGTLNVQVDGTRDEFQANWSAFTGQINLTGAGEFRIANFQNAVFNNAKLNIGAGVNLHQVFNPPTGSGTETVQNIGELSGSVGAILGGNPVGGRFVTWTVGALGTNSAYDGTIVDDAGAARLTKVGVGTLTLTGANTFTGAATISNGTIAVGNDTALGAGTVIFNGGKLASNNDSRSLANTVTVNNVAGNQITGSNSLTLTGSASGAGTLQVNFTDTTKTLTVNPATNDAFAPAVINVTGGTLLLGGADKIGNTTALTLSGGTFNTGGFSETLGSLTLSASSIIDFGAGASTLTFADSTNLWTTGTTLSIWNWSGTPVDGGAGTDQLRFASNGLSAAQLGQINFYSDAGVNKISITPEFGGNGFVSFGEVVPVPEPSAIAVAMGLLGMVGWRERRQHRIARRIERTVAR